MLVSTVRYREEVCQERNEAREIIATLPISRLEDLARDFWCELVKRYPDFTEKLPLATSTNSYLRPILSPPIAFFPAEILSMVISLAQDGTTQENIQIAVSSSHVCQFWRNVAIYTAYLWTDIDLEHPGCQTFAQRSLILPIHISMVEKPHPRHKIYQRASPRWLYRHSDRIRAISLTACRRTLEDVLSYIGTDLSALVSMDMIFTPHTHNEMFHLHAPGLRHIAPHLRRLHLSNVRMDLGECGDLTHLSLHHAGRVPAKELIPLLRRSPNLREMTLKQVVLDDWDMIPANWNVTLGHLEVLQVDPMIMGMLNSCVSISTSTPLFSGRSVTAGDAGPLLRPAPIYSKPLIV